MSNASKKLVNPEDVRVMLRRTGLEPKPVADSIRKAATKERHTARG
jgi:hypothetical protein